MPTTTPTRSPSLLQLMTRIIKVSMWEVFPAASVTTYRYTVSGSRHIHFTSWNRYMMQQENLSKIFMLTGTKTEQLPEMTGTGIKNLQLMFSWDSLHSS